MRCPNPAIYRPNPYVPGGPLFLSCSPQHAGPAPYTASLKGEECVSYIAPHSEPCQGPGFAGIAERTLQERQLGEATRTHHGNVQRGPRKEVRGPFGGGARSLPENRSSKKTSLAPRPFYLPLVLRLPPPPRT